MRAKVTACLNPLARGCSFVISWLCNRLSRCRVCTNITYTPPQISSMLQGTEKQSLKSQVLGRNPGRRGGLELLTQGMREEDDLPPRRRSTFITGRPERKRGATFGTVGAATSNYGVAFAIAIAGIGFDIRATSSRALGDQ
jgi:hypothetical protein